jgi:hypothetical protein
VPRHLWRFLCGANGHARRAIGDVDPVKFPETGAFEGAQLVVAGRDVLVVVRLVMLDCFPFPFLILLSAGIVVKLWPLPG